MSELAKRLREKAMLATGIFGVGTEESADLLAAADAIEAGEWREIESAPKSDLKACLLYWPEMMGTALKGYWSEYRRRWCATGYGLHEEVRQPTHYLPLPAPPKAKR